MESLKIRVASAKDCADLLCCDKHIVESVLIELVKEGNVIVAEVNGKFAGWLRYNLFWDSIPFMNMLYVAEDYRGKGIASELVDKWEKLVKMRGFNKVMTSTQACESSQHLYRKLGYKDLGGFMPFDEEYEIILGKKI